MCTIDNQLFFCSLDKTVEFKWIFVRMRIVYTIFDNGIDTHKTIKNIKQAIQREKILALRQQAHQQK